MNKSIPITKFGYQILKKKQQELNRVLKKPGKKSQSFEEIFMDYKAQLEEIDSILDNSVVTEFDEKQPPVVQIGSRVTIENLANGVVMEYTILSRATADPTKGIISNESPLAEKILGLKLGNTFKFKSATGTEESYKITKIE